MPSEQTKNFAVSTVATAPSPATSGTSLTVDSGHGARFPAAAFNAVVCPVDAQPTPLNAEVVRVTAGFGTDTFTITRATESSTARSIVVGDRIVAGATAKTLSDAYAYIDSLIAVVSGVTVSLGTEIDVLAGAYRPVLIQPPVQRVSAAGALTRGAVSLLAAPPAFVASGSANAHLQLIPILAADMNVSGRTTKLMTKITVGTDAVAPGINFTASLIVLSGSAGGTDSQNYTWGSTVVTNSTATLTAPALNTVTTAASAAYDLPADGTYVLIVSTSGTMATNARATIHPSLWVAHV